MKLNSEHLSNCFNMAMDSGASYVAVVIRMEGFPADEIIINNRENFEKKLNYYMNTYDDNLEHKYSKGIFIVGFTYGNSFGDIEEDLI